MRIAVCDDLKEERVRLISMLRDYLASKDVTADICEYESGESLAEGFTPGTFNLVFLDIYMEGMTSVETARQLKTADPDCVIVFTTTSREHGAEAFDLEAFHYLVKPVDKDKLFAILAKWYNMLCEVKTVTLKCGRATREVFVRDIMYIEVQGRSSSVHTAAGVFETSMPLSAIEAMLPDGEFCRPIRYFLASLRYIRGVGEDSLTLLNGEKLPVTRNERVTVKNQLAAYRLRVIRGR